MFMNKVVDTIRRVGATEEDFLTAQFQGADASWYPKMQDLYDEPAVDRWKLYVFNRNVTQHVRTQRVYLNNAIATWGMSAEHSVMLPFIPFTDWFRVLHVVEPLEEWKKQALQEISNPVLYRAIEEAGYKIYNITRWRKI